MPIIGGGTPAQSGAVAQDIVKVPNTTFAYSMTRIADLEASEYTQVEIVSDVSPSVEPWKKEMEDQLKVILESCAASPRAQNLLMRHTMFASSVRENHGWKMLSNIVADDYDNCLKISGSTALFDGTLEAVEVMRDSGAKLKASKFTVNGIIFVITDGVDNASHHTPSQIKAALDDIRQKESLESLVTILIGVGDDAASLGYFQKEAGITHFIAMKDASKSSLAKLAAFISKSISDQSQALGTGGPSKQLTSQSLTI